MFQYATEIGEIIMRKPSAIIDGNDPFDAFLKHEREHLKQDVDSSYLEIEKDIQEARHLSKAVLDEITKHIPDLIKRLDVIFLDRNEYAKFLEGKMDFERESDQDSPPMVNKPDYLQENESYLPALLVKIVDIDLNRLRLNNKSKKSRVFSFYFLINNPNLFLPNSSSKISAYCNNFDKMLVLCNSYSDIASYEKMNLVEKQVLITNLLNTHLIQKVMTHELRHSIDESIGQDKNIKHIKKNDIAKAFLDAINEKMDVFLAQDNAISQTYSDMIESPLKYVRADIQIFLKDKTKIKKNILDDVRKNPYNKGDEMYEKYNDSIPMFVSFLDVSFDVLDHFAIGEESKILKKYAIDLNDKQSIFKNLCALRIFYFLDYFSQNLNYFIGQDNGLVIQSTYKSVDTNESFYLLSSKLEKQLSTIILDSEVPTYRADSIIELMLSFALGISLDEIPYFLHSQQALNGILFSAFKHQEYMVDDIASNAFDALSYKTAIQNHCLNFNEQIDPSILSMLDNANIDWQYPDYKDQSLEMLNIFLKTHSLSEDAIPNDDIVEFVNFLEDHRKNEGRKIEMNLSRIQHDVIFVLLSRSFFVSSFSKIYRDVTTTILYDSLLENPIMAENIHFFDRFSEHIYESKEKVLDSLRFSKTESIMLRPFLEIMFCEKRNFESLLFKKSKLDSIYNKSQIPHISKVGDAFVREMLGEYQGDVDTLIDLNKKYIGILDQIIDLTRVECLELSSNKKQTQKSIDIIEKFFSAITQEQNDTFVELTNKKKKLDSKTFDKISSFYDKMGETLYHLITANIKKPYSKNIFDKYVSKKKSKGMTIEKYINAQDFISLDEFVRFLKTHFCYFIHCSFVYDASNFENLFGYTLELTSNLPYCFDLKYRMHEYENAYQKLCETINSIVDLIEKSSDVDIVERMELIIIIASFMKFLRIDM